MFYMKIIIIFKISFWFKWFFIMFKLKIFKIINSIVIINKVIILFIMLEINIFFFGRWKSVELYFNLFFFFYVLILFCIEKIICIKIIYILYFVCKFVFIINIFF